jgi:hypothetical protein
VIGRIDVFADELEHRDGVPWWDADPGPRLLHRCKPQTKGWVGLRYVERCSCGAFGPRPFFRIDPYPSRAKRRKRREAAAA